MSGRVRVAGIVLASALAGSALAQYGPPKPIIGERAPDIRFTDSDSKFTEERDKGISLLERYADRIILLFFFRTDDPASVEALPLMKELQGKLGGKGVVFIPVTSEKKETAETAFKARDMGFEFAIFGNLHVFYGVSAFPRVYMIDTNGILADHFHPADRMEERILAQMRRTPPPGADPQTFHRWLQQARTAVSEKRYGRAYTYARDVRSLTDNADALHKEAEELVKSIEESTKTWLEEARTAANGKEYDKACDILAEVSIRFEGTDLGAEADREISRLMGDGTLKPKLNRAKEEAKGDLRNASAAELLITKRYYEALKAYRAVSETYPDTKAAAEAEKVIDKINDDPEAQALIKKARAEEEADRWLDIGDRYARARLYSKAREYYEKIRQTHPNTPSAARVEQRLKDLPQEDQPAPEGEAGGTDTAAGQAPGDGG